MSATNSTVCTTCPYCGVGCGVLATPDGKGGALIAGDPAHPANFGRLCSKGSALGETLDYEGRLLTPQIGGLRAGWDEALDLVSRKFSAAIRDHGSDSVAFYVSGQLLTEDYYVANKLMKGFIGSGNIDTNSRLCMSSSVAGHKRAFGTDTVPGTYEDLEEADLIVLVGSNLAWCHPVLHQRIMAAREKRPVKIVTVDPRETATAQMSDMHLAIESDGDVALFNGLLAHIAEQGAVDAAYVGNHVDGFDDALNAASSSSHECGLARDQQEEFYRLWTRSEKVVTVYSQGVNQSSSGTDKVNAIINCHLATGRIGKPGMGPFSVTGQPNAMGGREVGGLANMLAAHLDIEKSDHRAVVTDFWKAPGLATAAGLKAVDMFEACASGQIKALWIMGTNPAVSMPSANAVSDAIRACEFVVVSDVVSDTDTTACGDVLLPALGWGEKDGTVTNSERRISRQRAFLPPPGEARADWHIICDVADRMGFGEAFQFDSPVDIFAEHAALSALAVKQHKDFDIGLLGSVDYDQLQPTQWPVTTDGNGGRFFADGVFYTDTGRAKMLAISPQPNPVQADADYPFILNTGRIRDQWHTMTRTGKSQRLSQHIAEPYVDIHPEDALAAGIRAADIVQLDSPFGRLFARAQVTNRTPKGNVFVPIHWSSRWSANAKPSALAASNVDPVSGQPALKRNMVSMSKFDAGWYGFAISTDEPNPKAAYWAKARIGGGWRTEMAGRKAPDDWIAYAREMFDLHDIEPTSVVDFKSGIVRLVFAKNGVIKAAFFADRKPVAIARNFLISEYPTAESPLRMLAGIPSADQPDPGAIICTCFNVGVNTIVAAIMDGNLMSVDAVGKAINAGTNCGSCRPELEAILKTSATQRAANSI